MKINFCSVVPQRFCTLGIPTVFGIFRQLSFSDESEARKWKLHEFQHFVLFWLKIRSTKEGSNTIMEAETTQSVFATEISVCGGCKEPLQGKNPQLLLCLHSICKSCLDNQLEDGADQNQGQGEIFLYHCRSTGEVTK